MLLTANEAPGGFVNGDMGTVVAFRQPSTVEVEALVDEGKPLLSGEAARSYPVVRFRRQTRSGESERLVLPHDKQRRLYRVGVCIRRRLPLQLAWAITVHKSQGMSLPRLTAELGNAFAKGQCYVAMSRATSLDGLCLRAFDADKVKLVSHEAKLNLTLTPTPALTPTQVKLVSHEAKRFHAAAREASDIAARLHDAVRAGGPPAAAASLALGTNAQPLADYYRRTHFWWKEVVQGPATHAKWNDVFCGRGEHGDDQPTSTAPARTTFASEFCRWESNYPVPEHLRRLER